MWTPLAFERDEYKLARAAGPVFSHQFILTPDPIDESDEFQRHDFAGLHLYTGAKLNVQMAKSKATEVMVLGVAVDPDGHVLTSERLMDILRDHKNNLAETADYLSMSAGRYIFAISNSRSKYLYLDPTGMLSAACDPKRGVIASVATLAVPGPVEPSDYPMWEEAAYPRGARFSFGYTLDRRVRQLLPNHRLDLKTFTSERHWPSEAQDLRCASPERAEEVVKIASDRHIQVISALARHFPVALPVTAGQDSRLLLAHSKTCLKDIKLFFTHVTNFNTERDAEIGKTLCDKIGAPHTTFRVIGNFGKFRPDLPLPDLRRRMLIRAGYLVDEGDLELDPQQKRELAAAEAVPEDHLVLRGHVTDISKAVLWRFIGLKFFKFHRTDALPAETAIRLMQLRPAKSGIVDFDKFNPLYNAWIKGLPKELHRRSVDMLGVEQYRPYSLGLSFNSYQRNFYLAPGNDRRIIAALATPPPDLRAMLYVNDMLLQQTVPEFCEIEYVRADDNAIRERRWPMERSLDTQ
ncbi:hypothetical protein [Aliiroseovarius marinus]|uniref:hypothetical protein n=1 Tax=Aliiroseovarius marinus TaxID=2500159 RepID=UPI003D7D7FC4